MITRIPDGSILTRGGRNPLVLIRRLSLLCLGLVFGILAAGTALLFEIHHEIALIVGGMLVMLSAVGLPLGFLLRREWLHRMAAEAALVESTGRLNRTVLMDTLTQLANRRAFEDRLVREWKRAIRSETGLALLIVDLDYFESYNERYGRLDGDGVLQRIASCLAEPLRRPADLVARYGGQAFAMLLPETTITGARSIAERIRTTITNANIEHAGAPGGRLTVSIGVAARRPGPGKTEDSLVKAADAALGEAKRGGGNQVCIARRKGAAASTGMPATNVGS